MNMWQGAESPDACVHVQCEVITDQRFGHLIWLHPHTAECQRTLNTLYTHQVPHRLHIPMKAMPFHNNIRAYYFCVSVTHTHTKLLSVKIKCMLQIRLYHVIFLAHNENHISHMQIIRVIPSVLLK